MSTNWLPDHQKWLTDAAKHDADLSYWADDKWYYNGAPNGISTVVSTFDDFCKSHTPEEAMMYFLTIVLAHAPQPAGSNPNILAMYQDQIACYGDSMAVAADTTQLTNDLQNMFNSSSTAGADVTAAYDDLTDLIGIIGSATPNNVTKSFDPNQIQSILTQLNAIESNMTKYFSNTVVPGGLATGGLTSFGQMNTEMGEKGDPDHAIEAAQGFTNANQALTANLQNVNASLNQQVSLTTGMINAWQSFESAVMKNFISEISASIQNEIAGG